MSGLWKWLLTIFILLCLGGSGFAVYWFYFRAPAAKVEAVKVPDTPYSAFARGRVDVEGGLVNIAAKKDGIIKEVLVEEGDRVTKGQVLCRQDDTAERLALELTKAEVVEAERKIDRAKVQLDAARREDDRYRLLSEKSLTAKETFDNKHANLLTAQKELDMASASLETAKRNQAVAEYDVEQRIVRAPAEGTILRCDVRPGYGTTSSSNVTRLFVFVPDLPFIVRAELEEKFVKLVKMGMKAEVIPDADESKSYSATVIRVSNYLGPKRMTFDDPQEKNDVKTAECVLAIDAKGLILQQRVLVKIKKDDSAAAAAAAAAVPPPAKKSDKGS